jgi:hypothetical protein
VLPSESLKIKYNPEFVPCGILVRVHKVVAEVLLGMEPASFEIKYKISSRPGKNQSLCPDSINAEQFRAAVVRFTAERDS